MLTQRIVNPHISIDALRTNRHFVWMIPVADVVIFSVVGLALSCSRGFDLGLRNGSSGGSWSGWRS